MRSPEQIYIWRKVASPHWFEPRGDILQTRAGGALVVVQRPGRTRLQIEIVCGSENAARALLKEFGGRVEKLSHEWLERCTDRDSKPIKVGKRLIVVRPASDRPGCSLHCLQRSRVRRAKSDVLRTAHATGRTGEPQFLVIPASIAFGTGEHVTTAMSLRLLEELTRHWKHNWSLVDLGTGTGILALAAKRLGAGRLLGIDNDVTAISTAESNARLNKIHGVSLEFGDVRKWRPARRTDVIIANLYNDLLVEILSNLPRATHLIFSGILRRQESEFLRALRRNGIAMVRVKRRGKWIAVLGNSRGGYW